jgi:AcrR family transcriptional regulator
MEMTERAAGRRRDPRTDSAAVEVVLDLVSAGASLSGLSLVTIAEQAGVSRNSLYRRWKTKEDLYLDVLGTINSPLPDFDGPSVREDLVALLSILAERTLDRRANSMLRALTSEAGAFPELYRHYFDDIVAPRRETAYRIIRRGIAAGEIRPDVDVGLVREVLVAPILAQMSSDSTEGLDPQETSRQIVDLVYDGIRR